MSQDALIVTLDGPASEDDAVARSIVHVLDGVYKAMDMVVAHLSGAWPHPDVRPYWSETLSRLQFVRVQPGYLVAVLTVDVPHGSFREGAESPSEVWRLEREYGQQALAALREWNGEADSTLPRAVTDCLFDAASHLPKGTEVWLGSDSMSRRVLVMHPSEPQALATLSAQLHGWLKAVNWDQRTARLYDAAGGYVRLRFGERHDQEMRRLATQYVEVEGQGEINGQDQWEIVRVEELRETPSWSEPFDLDSLLNDASPKVFDPDNLVTASEPFDVDEFLREIHEGRDVGREASPE